MTVETQVETSRESKVDAATERPTLRWPVAALLSFSTIFIARTSLTHDGTRYFTLFDDAMISMRYARNFAEGHGLVWNIGEPPIEGFTNPLWTFWMAALHQLPVPMSKLPLLVMLSGVALLVLNVFLVRAVAWRVSQGSRLATTASIWLAVTYYPLAFWTLRGMEVGLVACCVTASVLLVYRILDDTAPKLLGRDSVILATVLALGLLTRTDFAVPALVSLAYLFFRSPGLRIRRVSLPALVCVVTLVGQIAFRSWYFGELVPNTYALKLENTPFLSRLEAGALATIYQSVIHFALPILILVSLAIWRRRWLTGTVLLPVLLFVAQFVYSTYVGGDAWETFGFANRYQTVVIPVLFTVLVSGFVRAGFAPPQPSFGLVRRLTWALVGVTVVASLAWLVTSVHFHKSSASYLTVQALAAVVIGAVVVIAGRRVITSASRTSAVVALTIMLALAINANQVFRWLHTNAASVNEDRVVTRHALTVREATTPGSSIAVTWAGAYGYWSDRPVIDLLGKSDRVIAHRPSRPGRFIPGHTKWDYVYSIGQLKPDVIVQLWKTTPEDERYIRDVLGYDHIGGLVYASPNSANKVDRQKLVRVVNWP